MREPVIHFVVYGDPIPQLRPRVVRNKYTGGVHSFVPDKCTAHAEKVRLAAVEVIHARPDFKRLTGPLRLDAVFYRSRPKSAKRGSLPTTRPDASNYVKLVEDSLTGLVYNDDSQIVCVWLAKRYAADGEQPRTEVAIYEVTEQTATERPSADQLSIFGLDQPTVA